MRLVPVPKLKDGVAPKPRSLSVIADEDDSDAEESQEGPSGLIVVEELPKRTPQKVRV